MTNVAKDREESAIRLKIYVETSIPSYYHELRTDPGIVALKNWTQHWWDFKRAEFDIFTSEAVLRELENGDYPTKVDAISLLKDVPVLAIEPPITEIVEAYIQHHLMPANPAGDALHLALASYYRCDFLLTWNCKHLANANKYAHIQRLNVLLGLYNPRLVTPLEFLDEEAL
jgi:predicted nucleic acid-binding protein